MKNIYVHILQNSVLLYSFCFILCLFIPMTAMAQTGIQGQVTDANTDEPLVGATIFIVETEQGTTTDIDGEYELTGIEPGTYTLRVTFIGYQMHQQEVEIGFDEMLPYDIALSRDALGLDELVVTGYSIRERREVTGAISSIRADQIRARAIQTPDQAIQGRTAGTQMVGSSGQPGAASNIRIRGTGSINAGNAPLYIVDGVPIEDFLRSDIGTINTNVLLSLNPSDIESIDVLRDAEATAIYGAQGANGVVLITTTRGQMADTEFTLNIKGGAHQLHTSYDFMTGPEQVTFMQEAYANRYMDLGLDPEEGRQAAIESYGHPDEVGTYNWFDAVTRTGYNQRYSLAARGGTETTRFYISGGYEDHQGTILGSTFDRVSLRSNIDHDATERITFTTNLNLSRSQYNGQIEGGGNFIASPFHGAVTTRPTTPIYLDDGTFNQDIPAVNYNVVQVLQEEDRIGREFQLIGNVAATFNVSPSLAFRAQYNADLRLALDRRYASPSIPRYQTLWGGRVDERTRETQNYSGNLVADYMANIQQVHNISAVVGGEYRNRDYRFHRAIGDDIPNPLLGQLNLAGIASAVSGRATQYKTAGLFSRFQYNYDERYFTSVNLRYDGHSRFGAEQRWGVHVGDRVAVRSRFAFGASCGITIVAGTPSACAAHATAWAWLPEE
jgi:TonB-dependent starch-binding outer membrane protein SusC